MSLPSRDNEFRASLQNFLSVCQGNLARLGLQATDLTGCSSSLDTFSTRLEDQRLAQSTAKQATAAKNIARDAAAEAYRSLVKLVETKPGLTDDLREALGLARVQELSPALPQEQRPLVLVQQIEPYQHTLKIVNAENPSRRGKPSGVFGTEVYAKISPEPPTGPDDPQLKLVGVTTTGKLTVSLSPQDVGKTTWYVGFYRSTRGQRGPVGEAVAATIAA